MAQTPSDFIPSVDVCRELSIDRSTLTRWVQSGRIVPVGKLPGRTGAYLFAPAEVARVKRELRAASSA